MKILVVYASVGTGHTSAAQAVYSYFKEHSPNCDIKIIDILQYSNWIFRNFYIKEYSFLVKHATSIWALGYLLTSNKFLRPFIRTVGSILNRLNTTLFCQLLIQEDADAIISTHFLSSEIASNLKEIRKIKSKLFTIITDYVVHPFWISHRVDYYVVASKLTKQYLMQEGTNENIIKDIGIPVSPKFLVKSGKDKLTEKLGIQKDRFTVLVVSGSFGVGPIERIVDLLYKDVQLLVVTAHNKKLYEKLKRKNLTDVYIYGFVDNMQELMAASDMIITKPGGLTISEILNMELIPVFIYPIPGQETGNIGILKKYGIGFSAKTLTDLKNIVLDFKQHPDKLRCAKDKLIKIKQPDTLGELFNAVCKSSSGLTR
jgi:processive 1,2-diacylglycerol beta-glucosyltransferase